MTDEENLPPRPGCCLAICDYMADWRIESNTEPHKTVVDSCTEHLPELLPRGATKHTLTKL